MATPAVDEEHVTALAEVVRRARTSLVRAAQREGLGAEDAIECVQDALCTFLGRARRSDVPSVTEEWTPLLTAMVRNAARNKRRRHALARPHEAVEDAEPIDTGARSDEAVLRAETHGRLHACVAELCEIQRAVVMLRLLDEQPGEDVAASLGISRGYVDVLAHRAKASLRACMLRGEDLV